MIVVSKQIKRAGVLSFPKIPSASICIIGQNHRIIVTTGVESRIY